MASQINVQKPTVCFSLPPYSNRGVGFSYHGSEKKYRRNKNGYRLGRCRLADNDHK